MVLPGFSAGRSGIDGSRLPTGAEGEDPLDLYGCARKGLAGRPTGAAFGGVAEGGPGSISGCSADCAADGGDDAAGADMSSCGSSAAGGWFSCLHGCECRWSGHSRQGGLGVSLKINLNKPVDLGLHISLKMANLSLHPPQAQLQEHWHHFQTKR